MAGQEVGGRVRRDGVEPAGIVAEDPELGALHPSGRGIATENRDQVGAEWDSWGHACIVIVATEVEPDTKA